MESATVARALAALATYGYPILTAVALAEHTFIIGLLAPGDSFIVIAGVLVARDLLEPEAALLATLVGTAAGLAISYAIGVRGGVPVVERWGEKFGLQHEKLEALRVQFTKHAGKTIFVASLVSGLKNVVPALAGAARIGWIRCLAWAFAGSAIRAVGELLLGYFFGANLERALAIIGRLNRELLVVLVVAVVLAVILRRVRAKRAG